MKTQTLSSKIRKREKNIVGNRVTYFNIKDYAKFIENNPRFSHITYKQWKSVLKQCFLEIRETVLNNELGFKYPRSIGYSAVNKFKTLPGFKSIDFKNSNIYDKEIPNTNFHSFGHAYKIQFFRNPRFSPMECYKVKAHRTLNRELAQYIKSKNKDYLQLNKYYFNKRFNIANYLKLS